MDTTQPTFRMPGAAPAAPAPVPELEPAGILLRATSQVLVIGSAEDLDSSWVPERQAMDYWVVDIYGPDPAADGTEPPANAPLALTMAQQQSNGLRHPATPLEHSNGARVRCAEQPQARLMADQLLHNLRTRKLDAFYRVEPHGVGGTRWGLRDKARRTGLGDGGKLLGLEIPLGCCAVVYPRYDEDGRVLGLDIRVELLPPPK